MRFSGLITIGLLVGCGARPPTPAVPGDDPAFTAPEVVMPAGLEEDPAQPLRVLAGDVIRLEMVSAETQTYEGLIVDELGAVHVPLAGSVTVGGATMAEAQGRIQGALRRFDRVVHVNLFLEEPSGHRATVVGAVDAPGRVQVPPGTRLADLLALAGGLMREVSGAEATVLADLDGARLVRDRAVLPVNLRLALGGNPQHNVRVRAGDHLYVPPLRGQRITVLGEVRAATVLPYHPGIRITEALAIAGGITIDGDNGDIRVVRGALREPQVYATNLQDLVDGESHNVELAPGDIVYVTDHWIASVGEVLDRLSPLLSAATTVGLAVAITR